MSANLQNPIFIDETKAREWLEARVWPKGPVCPHCGATGDDVTALNGKAHRPGLYQCSQCREQFTVTVKTVFERSKIPLSKWLAALFMMTASKKGVSAHQIHRSLDISYKTAWFLCHRLREAMRQGGLPPLGGEGKVIESDETYWGPKDIDRDPAMKRRRRGKPGPGGKARIMTLVERGGEARSVHVADLTNETMKAVLLRNATIESKLMTDEGTSPSIGMLFSSHKTVKHSADEYVRVEYPIDGGPVEVVSTNTVEGFSGLFKRGLRGIYQHCGEKHLHRYLAEFDFRYNTRTALGYNDLMRAEKAAEGIKGKRLTYRRPHKIAQPGAH